MFRLYQFVIYFKISLAEKQFLKNTVYIADVWLPIFTMYIFIKNVFTCVAPALFNYCYQQNQPI